MVGWAFMVARVPLYPQAFRKLNHESKVMHGCQPQEKAVVDLEEMMEICHRIARAAQAVAELGNRSIILGSLVIINVQVRKPLFCRTGCGQRIRRCEHIESRVTRIPRRHGAIEEIIANPGTIHDIRRVADTKRVHRQLWRDELPGIRDNIGEQLPLVIQGPAPEAKAIETDLQERIRALLAQLAQAATLDDAK